MMRQRSPEYRKLSVLQNKVIAIEGPIGVGKSTLGAALHAYTSRIGLTTRFEPECVDTSYLNLYLKSKEKMRQHAFGFQKDTLQSRKVVHERSEEFAARGGTVFIDRSILGDIAFAKMQRDDGMFDEEEWASYCSVIERSLMHEPSIVLHLVCDVDTLLARIKKRSRNGETIYTPEYLEKHHAATVAVLQEYYRGEVITMDWSPALTVSGNNELEITDEQCFDILYRMATAFLRPHFETIADDVLAKLHAPQTVKHLATIPVKRQAAENDPEYRMVIDPSGGDGSGYATVHFEDKAGKVLNLFTERFLVEEVELDANGVEVSWTEALLTNPDGGESQEKWILEEGIHYRLSYDGETLLAIVPRSAQTAVTPYHVVVPVPKPEKEDE